MLKNVFVFLRIIQEKRIEGKLYKRLNPFNPLTYIFVAIAFIIAVIMFGIKGWRNEFNFFNEFQYKR